MVEVNRKKVLGSVQEQPAGPVELKVLFVEPFEKMRLRKLSKDD